MSAATPTQSPAVGRSQSTHKPQPTYIPPDSPSRARSNASRPTSSSQPRGAPGMYRVDRSQAPPIANQAQLVNVVRRDAEDTNLAQSPSTRRSSSKDRYYDQRPPSYRTHSETSHHRNTSRHGSRRPSAEIQTAAPDTNGAPPVQPPAVSKDAPPPPNYQQGRRRTTITTQTGTWHLGKTIGQGSMGKVKLGKNLETGETVSWSTSLTDILS